MAGEQAELEFSMTLAGGHDQEEAMDSSQVEEVVVMKTDPLAPDDTKPAMLPQIPFSFPGQTFDTKCQKLILNVWDFFKRLRKNPDILDEIRTPQERAAAALHISAATIGKIGKNFKKTGKLETPGISRKRSKPVVDSVSAEDEDVIRDIINTMKAEKTIPTLPSVMAEARERINFQGGSTSFRRILQRMGFRNLSQTQKNVNVVEKPKENLKTTTATTIQTQQTPASPAAPQQTILTLQAQSSGSFKIVKTEPESTESSVITTNATATNVSTPGATIAQPITLTQESATTILNAAQLQGLGGTQTFYIQQPDNTIRPIQIVYASNINS